MAAAALAATKAETRVAPVAVAIAERFDRLNKNARFRRAFF
jgi:hypothetical protein